jgi:S1-C subfamily serine protease
MKLTVVLVLAAALAGAVAGAVIGVALGGSSSPEADPATTPAAEVPVSVPRAKGLTGEQIYRADAPGVVVITATKTEQVPPTLFTPAQTEKIGVLGSGFVIDRKGDVVTNDHVVGGGTGIRVGFSSGATYPARVVGADPSSDIAVVRVSAPRSALHPLALGHSAAVEVGEPVYAIGNPFGLDRTMTAGIVSATERDIQAPNKRTIPNAIQTDAPINHGNSGGPLIDDTGRVIGVNDQIEGGTVNGNIGIGFAVGSDTARSVAHELVKTGRAEHAWLGVQVETVDPTVSSVVRGLPKSGATITRIARRSPASKAGLKASTGEVTVNGVTGAFGGDTIVAVDGKSVATADGLASLVASRRPGDRLRLTVVRGAKRASIVVTLGNVPSRAS